MLALSPPHYKRDQNVKFAIRIWRNEVKMTSSPVCKDPPSPHFLECPTTILNLMIMTVWLDLYLKNYKGVEFSVWNKWRGLDLFLIPKWMKNSWFLLINVTDTFSASQLTQSYEYFLDENYLKCFVVLQSPCGIKMTCTYARFIFRFMSC